MGICIKKALQEAASFLRRRGIAAPRREAEVMLAFLLGQGAAYLYAHGEKELSGELRGKYAVLLQRRGENVPLAYLTGEKEFMGLPFRVQAGVLIPRPETEHLVETALQWCRETFPQVARGQQLHILDLGTGCGNIAVSLAYFLPAASVLGVDCSAKALAVARLNAQKMGVAPRVHFFCGAFGTFFAYKRQRFHVVVANPPYVPRPELPVLPPEVQKEPSLALDGGEDGLAAYRQIFSCIQKFLFPGGLLALEVGANQAGAVLSLGRAAGLTGKTEIVPDLAGHERVVTFRAGQGRRAGHF
ncbi:MAG: peptide chain release factor N(5)-glutamine methyltransferase [Firmicutes bacterium]|nr:peptide chain release factor N(5)-glutamine methyltransferase [Bacillota bacterium]